ncbi:mitofilin family membrane protein [Roseibium sp.]|uniref:mitofilin family membrane protein n=1 Tax=Roseibium sp. TaxID=1936156 RepID=UPI0032630A91
MIGGFLVLGGGYGLYKAGLVDLPQEPDQQLTSALGAAERKIADLEEKLGDVTSAVSRQSTSGAVSALESKVSELESTLSEATSAASADLAPAVEALKTDLESLRADMSAGTSGGAAGVPVDLKPLQDRLTALEDTAKSPDQGQPPVDLAPLEQRLSALEKDTGSSAAAADKLSGSVSGLEAQLSDFKTTLAGVESRTASAEATAKAAQAAVSTSDVSLKTLADSQARATETLSSLAADIKSVGAANTAALESVRSDLDAISKRLAAVEATMGDATAREVAARALSVSALKSAVDSGRAYETELAAVKAGLPADIDLSALEAHAKTGVEPVSVLIAGFPPVGRKIYQTFSEPDRTGDVLDSLLSSARSIVSVRGLGDDEGTGPDAVLRRMETAVSSGDLKAALAAYQELPGDSQAVAADWAARAQARVEVNDLTDKASQEVLNALAGKDN